MPQRPFKKRNTDPFPSLSWRVRFLLVLFFLIAAEESIRHLWICDDAFISFRYAKHMAEGLGPVFNRGERVEGYTNLLWTLLLVPSFWMNIDPRFLSGILGILSYLTLLGAVLLYGRTQNVKRGIPSLPLLAFAGAALHHHLHIFATSGLETSLYTLFVTLGVLLAAPPRPSQPRNEENRTPERGPPKSGQREGISLSVLTLAALTRPDGLLPYGLTALYLFFREFPFPDRWKELPSKRVLFILLRQNLAFLLLFLPVWILRYIYYGLPLPNTFYAKSAYDPYPGQGLFYAGVYLGSYYVLPLLLLIAGGGGIFTAVKKRELLPADSGGRYSLYLFLLLFTYFAYVIWVGGDFMFGRFLVPVTPLLYLLLERLVRSRLRERKSESDFKEEAKGSSQENLPFRPSFTPGPLYGVFLAVTALLTLLRYDPFRGRELPLLRGISEEYRIYTPQRLEHLRKTALRYGEALRKSDPVVAFVGAQAALIYYWDLTTAIEAQTGLTDRRIASMPVKNRGRVGHEKEAPLSYLIERRTSLLLAPPPPRRAFGFNTLKMEGFPVPFEIVTYRPSVMESLRGVAGITFTDFPSYLEERLRNPRTRFKERELEFFRGYYFDHAGDPRLWRRVLERRDGKRSGTGGERGGIGEN